MFLKIAELKKQMKAALKSAAGLHIGNLNEKYVIQSSDWGLQTEAAYASNKFLAAVVELIGELPENAEYYRYWIEPDGVHQESVWEYQDIFERWKLAKDYAVPTPIAIASFPHEYQVFQVHSDLHYIWVNRERAGDLISAKELDSKVEQMPGRPSYAGGTLYWKNDTTIYYASRNGIPEKVDLSVFHALNGLDFSTEDWIRNPETGDVETTIEAGEEPLPY